MKSRITIEVDFENGNEPVIQLLQYPDSTDVRDNLLKHFCQQLGGSSWCKIMWKGSPGDFNRIHISPINPNQLKGESAIMLEQHEVHQKWLKNHSKDLRK